VSFGIPIRVRRNQPGLKLAAALLRLTYQRSPNVTGKYIVLTGDEYM
jgi:hypothetical protein